MSFSPAASVLLLIDVQERLMPAIADAEAVLHNAARPAKAALARAGHHGAELVTTEMVIFEWLANCRHPAFREALKLVK